MAQVTQVTLETRDGAMQLEVARPEGEGPWPAVLFCMDGGGLRASLREMAKRIADEGYLVVAPDFFHRAGSLLDFLPPDVPREHVSLFKVLGRPEVRAAWLAKFYGPATKPENLRADVTAVLTWLDAQPDALAARVGTTGYCMGGNVSLRLAGLLPERVAACASFHGGGLATDAPDSPHRAAGAIRAAVYVGAAIEDPSFPDAMKEQLLEALRAAGVEHTLETYDAHHGFAVPDSPTFDAAAAERHYAALFALLGRTLARR